mmetsp:Transcript_35153/g.59563  ORF Transcript_35153/g.59563 Transcript_35153/m.59563 type:complete len:279 (-) Transcript_35153:4340-5176(-)
MQRQLEHVRDEVDVALAPAALREFGERLLVGEPRQQQPEVLDHDLHARHLEARAEGDVPPVPLHLRVVLVVGDVGAEDGEQVVAERVRVSDGRALPLLLARLQPRVGPHGLRVAGVVDEVEVRHGGQPGLLLGAKVPDGDLLVVDVEPEDVAGLEAVPLVADHALEAALLGERLDARDLHLGGQLVPALLRRLEPHPLQQLLPLRQRAVLLAEPGLVAEVLDVVLHGGVVQDERLQQRLGHGPHAVVGGAPLDLVQDADRAHVDHQPLRLFVPLAEPI